MENLVGLWTNLSRTYEIALLGNFSIKVVFQKDYLEGFDDYETIKSIYKDVKFCKDGDLTIEIYKPDYQDNRVYESLNDILERVEKARKNEIPLIKQNDACDTLLKTAIDRLNLSYSKRDKIIEVAKIIAQLDNTKYVEPVHIAEAIHYNCVDETICNAEDKSISFGYGIKISKTELDSEDINNAISYLQSINKK